MKFVETQAEGKQIQCAAQYSKKAKEKSFELGETVIVFGTWNDKSDTYWSNSVTLAKSLD